MPAFIQPFPSLEFSFLDFCSDSSRERIRSARQRRPGWLYVVLTALLLTVMFASSAAAKPGDLVIEGDIDANLRSRIKGLLVADSEAPESEYEGFRRATDAAKVARNLLESEGFFDVEVEALVDENPPFTPQIKLSAGRQFRLAPFALKWDSPDPHLALGAVLDPLNGRPARAEDVLAAEREVLRAIQEEGYFKATTKPRQVVVDHATGLVEVTLHYQTGPQIRLDIVKFEGAESIKPEFLAKLTPIEPGKLYSLTQNSEWLRRVSGTGLFANVSSELREQPALGKEESAASGSSPHYELIIHVDEAKQRTIGFGGSWSTSEGFGAESFWQKRGIGGRADQLAIQLQAAQIEQSLDVEWSHPLVRADPNHRGGFSSYPILRTGLRIENHNTSAFNSLLTGVRLGVTQARTQGTSIFYGSTFDRNNIRDLNGNRTFYTWGGFLGGRVDRSNNALDPGSGWRLEARAEPNIAFGAQTRAFTRFIGGGTVYVPLIGRAKTANSATPHALELISAGRLRAGSVVGSSLLGLPADQRFYIGGGGSVRGFSFQSIAPRAANGDIIGGRSFTEASLEIRSRFTRGKWLKNWGLVGFIDGGSATSSVRPGFNNFRAGIGGGVRYDAGFGPLRLDFASPLARRPNEPKVQIYLSIGQAF